MDFLGFLAFSCLFLRFFTRILQGNWGPRRSEEVLGGKGPCKGPHRERKIVHKTMISGKQILKIITRMFSLEPRVAEGEVLSLCIRMTGGSIQEGPRKS